MVNFLVEYSKNVLVRSSINIAIATLLYASRVVLMDVGRIDVL